jgi:hypothetical protein
MYLLKRRLHDLLIYTKSVILLHVQNDNSSGLQVQSFFTVLQVSPIDYCLALLSFGVSQIKLLYPFCPLTACDKLINLNGIFVQNHRLHDLRCVELLGLKQKLFSSFLHCSGRKKQLLTCLIHQSHCKYFATLCEDVVTLLVPLLLSHQLCI